MSCQPFFFLYGGASGCEVLEGLYFDGESDDVYAQTIIG